METITIGKLAKKTNVNIETVRYYERLGLLVEPERTESGYRLYAEEEVARLRFIKRAQELGFSLKEIQDLLTLRVDQNTSCSQVKQRAEGKLADIDAKMKDLERIRRALEHITVMCTGQGPITSCPILDAMDMSEKEV